jgi:hypothetical protein
MAMMAAAVEPVVELEVLMVDQEHMEPLRLEVVLEMVQLVALGDQLVHQLLFMEQLQVQILAGALVVLAVAAAAVHIQMGHLVAVAVLAVDKFH